MYTRHDFIRPNRKDFLGIHHLWKKFTERDEKRRKDFQSWKKDLPKQIPFEDGKTYLYYQSNKGKLLKVEFTLVKNGIMYKHVNTDDIRGENLDFLTQDEKRAELGKYFGRKYIQLCKSTIKQDLYKKFWKHIENTLRNDDKHKYIDHKPQVITILVGDSKYWVSAKRRHETWVDYEFLGEANEQVIEIK
jgi:hypothetical protein